MKYLLILLVFPVLAASDCGKKKKSTVTDQSQPLKDSIPVCVRQMIDNAMKEVPTNPPVQIDQYVYNGKNAYLVTAGCCDQYNSLYDDSCKLICSPSGGITGRGDRKCEDFSKTATHVKKIWSLPSK